MFANARAESEPCMAVELALPLKVTTLLPSGDEAVPGFIDEENVEQTLASPGLHMEPSA